MVGVVCRSGERRRGPRPHAESARGWNAKRAGCLCLYEAKTNPSS